MLTISCMDHRVGAWPSLACVKLGHPSLQWTRIWDDSRKGETPYKVGLRFNKNSYFCLLDLLFRSNVPLIGMINLIIMHSALKGYFMWKKVLAAYPEPLLLARSSSRAFVWAYIAINSIDCTCLHLRSGLLSVRAAPIIILSMPLLARASTLNLRRFTTYLCGPSSNP